MNNYRDKLIERKPGEDEHYDPAEEARRIEGDVRATNGLGGLFRPKEKSSTEQALEDDTERL